MNNQARLIGFIASAFTFSHTMYGENFYNVTLCVQRDSGNSDAIPLIISDRILDVTNDYVNKCVYVTGEFRSYNQHDQDKTRVKLYVFINSIEFIEETKSINDVFLEGVICKEPIYRRTPLGREIADVFLAINRAYGKCDYIPCILWGRNAYYAQNLSVGNYIRVAGRIQSRNYSKDGDIKTAYELSVNLMEVIDR